MTDTSPFDERTIYSIENQHGERTTITLDKLTADVLQEMLPDVHDWVQKTYNRVVLRKPTLARREQGDLVRALANREAQSSPLYLKLIQELL